MARGRRFCILCGRRILSREHAYAMRRHAPWAEYSAGRIQYWQCSQCFEVIIEAIETIRRSGERARILAEDRQRPPAPQIRVI